MGLSLLDLFLSLRLWPASYRFVFSQETECLLYRDECCYCRDVWLLQSTGHRFVIALRYGTGTTSNEDEPAIERSSSVAVLWQYSLGYVNRNARRQGAGRNAMATATVAL